MAKLNENVEIDLKNLQKKDLVSLIISLIFVLVVGLFAYRYFNSAVQNFPNESEQEATLGSNSTNNGEIGDEGATTQENGAEGEENNSDTQGASTQSNGSTTTFGQWIANDYNQGDITAGNYTVVEGDTLWEIAEAVYGNGSEWVRILDANSNVVGYDMYGNQTLIVAGQSLSIPAMN